MSGAPPQELPTVQNLIDFFQALGDAGEIDPDPCYLHMLQSGGANDIQRSLGLWHLAAWPADDPVLTDLRCLLRAHGGNNRAGLLAARDCVCSRRHLPFADVNAMTLSDFVNALRSDEPAHDPQEEAPTGRDRQQQHAPPASRPKTPKRSTERGEARRKIIAALSAHHHYSDGGSLHLGPIGNNELAREAAVSNSTVSGFIKRVFGGRSQYRAVCKDAALLLKYLKEMNGDFPAHLLFGRTPPGEGRSDKDV
jgi:hypothetical protein